MMYVFWTNSQEKSIKLEMQAALARLEQAGLGQQNRNHNIMVK